MRRPVVHYTLRVDETLVWHGEVEADACVPGGYGITEPYEATAAYNALPIPIGQIVKREMQVMRAEDCWCSETKANAAHKVESGV